MQGVPVLVHCLCFDQVTAQAKEDSFRQLRRVAEKAVFRFALLDPGHPGGLCVSAQEEESEVDVVGLLEFRESEMRQLEQAACLLLRQACS